MRLAFLFGCVEEERDAGVDVEELRADNDELRRQNAELEAKAPVSGATLQATSTSQQISGCQPDAAAERAAD